MSWSSESSHIPPEVQLRDSLHRAQDANGATPSRMLDLLDTMTSDGSWRKLADSSSRSFDRPGGFVAFVTAPRPHGMGLADKDELRKQLALHHKEEREPFRRQATVDRMAEMRQRVETLLNEDTKPALPVGRPKSGDENVGGTDISARDVRGQVDYIVARLKRDAGRDPKAAGLLAEVMGGETKPGKAARQMGWRKPRIVLAKPETVAAALIEHMPPDALEYIAGEIAKHLKEKEN